MGIDNERNTSIVRELLRAMDAGHLAVLDSICAPDFIAHFNGIDLNLRQVHEAAAGFIAAFPDLKHSIQAIDGEGDRVTLRALDTATHRGAYKGIPPTNIKVQFETTAVYRIVEGKIVEVWQRFDVEVLLRQIGADPSPSGRRWPEGPDEGIR